MGLPLFVSQISPIVEVLFETPIEGGEKWERTGTVTPGLIWAGKYVEVGVESIIPINQRSGKDVGVPGASALLPRRPLADGFPPNLQMSDAEVRTHG